AVLDQGRFQAARQGVNTEEGGHIPIATLLGLYGIADAAHHAFGFFQAVLEGQYRYGLTDRILRDEILGLPLAIVGDQMAGGLEDRFGAAVIAFERNHTRARKIALKIKDITYIRSSPFIDRLV